MQTNWNWLPIFSKNGEGFYDLNKMKDVIDLSQFDAKELQTTTVDGKLNGIPISVTARVFYFNDETEKAGVEYPKTRDELMAAGKTFESKLGKQYYPVVLEHRGHHGAAQFIYDSEVQPAGYRRKKPRNSPTAKSSGSNSSRCIKSLSTATSCRTPSTMPRSVRAICMK